MSNPLDEKTHRRVIAEITEENTPYGNPAWHTNYMALCTHRDDDALRYIAEDCRKAVEAQPDSFKCSQYMDEQHYCHMELRYRNKNRERERLCAAVVERINSDMEAGRKGRIKKLVARVSIRDLKNYLGEK